MTSRVGRGTRVVDGIDIDRLELDSVIEDLVERARRVGVSSPHLIKLIQQEYG